MKRLKIALQQPEFHIFLFSLALVLFSYPLTLMARQAFPTVVFVSLFLPWGIIILLLFFVSKSYTPVRSDQGQDQEDGDVTNA